MAPHYVRLVSNEGFIRRCDIVSLIKSYVYFQILFSCIPDEELYPDPSDNNIPERRRSENHCRPGNHECGRFQELSSETIHFPQFSKEVSRNSFIFHNFQNK